MPSADFSQTWLSLWELFESVSWRWFANGMLQRPMYTDDLRRRLVSSCESTLSTLSLYSRGASPHGSIRPAMA